MSLSTEETKRYARHLTLPEVGIEGQEKLKAAKVIIVGAGGLGSPAALYLAAAGVGTIGIVDFDKVEVSNLQRQILHSAEDEGKPKTESGKETLERINPLVKIDTYNEKLTSKNALEMIKQYDVIIDGTDNFATRYLVNDACVMLNKPFCYGSIFQFDGMASVFSLNNGPCYRCMAPNPPPRGAIPNCAVGGVLGVLPGVIGTIQATEAIKIILGKGKTLSGRILVYNALDMKFKELFLKKNQKCSVCGDDPKITELIDYEHFCSMDEQNEEITVSEVKKMLDGNEDFVFIDVREPVEHELSKIEGTMHHPFSLIESGDLGPIKNLEKNKKIILFCHTGGRSAYVLQLLKKEGYTNVLSMTGGIDAWAKEIDRSLVVY